MTSWIIFWSCLGIFQYVRDILQVTVFVDNPVAGKEYWELSSAQNLGPESAIQGGSQPEGRKSTEEEATANCTKITVH